MGRYTVSYVGDLSAPETGDAFDVADDQSYILACAAVVSSLESGGSVTMWIHTRHHFSWMKDFFSRLRIDAEYSEKTAGTLLSEKWGVPISDWVSENDIISQNLQGLSVAGTGGKSFEACLVSALLGPEVGVDAPEEHSLRHLITVLTGDEYTTAKSDYPLLEEALRRLSARWHDNTEEEWMAELWTMVPEKVVEIWQLVTASALLRSYPEKLLYRILPPDLAALARKIPRTAGDDTPLEPNIREEALTQITLLLKDVKPQVTSHGEFRKIVSWVSGRTLDEFKLAEDILRNGSFEPNGEDVRIIREAFIKCPEVRRDRLDSLKYLVRPEYPALLPAGEMWKGSEWIRWTVDEYAPYRHWQVQNNRYDEKVENTVCHFSDWYVENYAVLQADSELGLPQVLKPIIPDAREPELTVILMVDCLPVIFSDTIDQALRGAGFKRHELSFRFAALPTVTEYNKAAVISGEPGRSEQSYSSLLSRRSARDWGGIANRYIATLKGLSELDPGPEASVILVNHIEGDEILHSDVESKNRTYEEELGRSYSHLAEALAEMCEKWPGPRDKISVILVTDHGACQVLEEERRSFDSSVIGKLFTDEKHRVATMPGEQAEKVPDNLWHLGYRFSAPLSGENTVHFLPRGHNTVRKSGSRTRFMHGGASPEEVIVPYARYGLVAVARKKPFTRFVNLDMTPDGKKARFYIQRVITIEVEIQNPNPISLRPVSLEVASPDATVKGVMLNEAGAESTAVIALDLYFQKGALSESELELKLRYTVGGDEYEQALNLPAEFKSAMSGGFSLKDL